MPLPSRRRSVRMHISRPGWRPLVVGCTLLGLSACAQLFTITPENGSAPAKPAPKVEKPAPEPTQKPKKEAPAPKVERPKAEQPKVDVPKVEKQQVEKPAPKPVRKPDPSKPDQHAQAVAAAPAPPAVRRPEPVFEPPALEPTPGGSDSAALARLTHAAALWDAVRLFHPAVAANRDEWDNITVRKLTDVRSANTRAQYETVMRDWLSRLNDPLTRIVSGDQRAAAPDTRSGSAEVTTSLQVVVTGTKKNRVDDTTVVVTWPTSSTSLDSAAWSNLRTVVHEVRNASQLVIDLRARASTASASFDNEAVRNLQLDVANTLATAPAQGAGVRRRVYEGWPDERAGVSSTLGVAAWRVSDPTVSVLPAANEMRTSQRIVFVADSTTQMAPALMALVSSHQATLVVEGELSDRLLVPVTRIALGDGLVAEVRTGELINANGNAGLQADTVLAPASIQTDSAPAMRVAVQVARGKVVPRASVASGTSASSAFANNALVANHDWTNAHYPIMGARLLAAFKMWGTLRAFHAYGDLRDENVEEALQRFLPRIEAATNAYSYAATMLEYATTLNDAQAVMTSPTLALHLGAAAAPFATRWIEGRAIVTQVANDEAGRATGLAVGDEISAADGYPMPAYLSEHRRYGAASNEWTQYRNTMALIPRGAPGDALLKVRDASNRERTSMVPRTPAYLNRFPESERTGLPVVRALTGAIGYMDLDRANEAQVDSAFARLGETRALILDARGRGRTNSSGAMSPALQNVLRKLATTQPGAAIDRQTIRVTTEACAPAESRIASITCAVERRQFEDVVSADATRRYKGRVIVLIDERTQGAMEQFGLGVESVANPTFIGSTSAGAAGAITSMTLPGHITLTFSGSELRHADGRQLQRVGITPQVEVAPTVKGVRAGTDEVLERAQQWLAQQLDPAPPKRKR
ncbi:MAG: S41 family peptidase [Gemmatimonadaceae bacterium]